MAAELNITGFLASNNWCTRFLQRQNLALRQKTKIAQKLPEDLDHKITDFYHFIIQSRRKENYELVHIRNIGETPVWFDMLSAKPWTQKEKKLLISTTGHEKFTAVLAYLADRRKLKPMVIFKRKTIPKENFPPGVLNHCHLKRWMDEAGMKLWIEKVWRSQPGGPLIKKSLLVWDLFRAHLVDPVKWAVRQTNTDITVIPGGLTTILQPLVVCLNKPFKDWLWTINGWTGWLKARRASLLEMWKQHRSPLFVGPGCLV